MEIVLKNSVNSITLEKFAEDNNLKLIVNTRSQRAIRLHNVKKYYIYFEGVEIEEGCMLISISGNGNTIDEALEDYKQLISGTKMVINAMCKDRKEFNLPEII